MDKICKHYVEDSDDFIDDTESEGDITHDGKTPVVIPESDDGTGSDDNIDSDGDDIVYPFTSMQCLNRTDKTKSFQNNNSRHSSIKSVNLTDGSRIPSPRDSDDSLIGRRKGRRVKQVVSDNSDDESNRLYDPTALSPLINSYRNPISKLSTSDESSLTRTDQSYRDDSDDSISNMKPNPYISDLNIKTFGTTQSSKSYMRNSSAQESGMGSAYSNNLDSSVTIIESNSSVVDILSSDDDEDVQYIQPNEKNRLSNIQIKEEPIVKQEIEVKAENSIKNYFVPESYPNSKLTYVSKQVKENETNKLAKLRAELQQVKHLVETLNVAELPDNGIKIAQRLSKLQEDVRLQGEKVAQMIVEPLNPTAADIAKDGFSWEELKAASNKVMPTGYSDRAVSNHLTERNHILDRLRDMHESLASRPAESTKASQPTIVTIPLMPHQLQALAWLQWRETQKPKGGILADDMGLGKTLTMISLIAQDNEKDELDTEDEWHSKSVSRVVKGGTLVVCPASLLSQWTGEVVARCRKHSLQVELYHGNHREDKATRLARNDLVVTTYNLVSRELAKPGLLTQISWRRIILDEAHVVRNHKSVTAQAVFGLRSAARWCLTGTPVQNKDLDMFALLKFLKCTPFDEIAMWKKWIDNKSAGGQERMASLMRCLLLRRTKQQLQDKGSLQDLPTKNIVTIEVTLAKQEMNVYQKVLVFSKTLFAQFLHQRAEKDADMQQGFLHTDDPDKAYMKMHQRMVALHGATPVKAHEILVLLLRLRQLCCHAGLIVAMLDPDEARDAIDAPDEDPASVDLLKELANLNLEDKENNSLNNVNIMQAEGTTVTEAIKSVLSISNPVFNLQSTSTKIEAVLKCLQENVLSKKDDKAVIVSQWTSVLSIVEQHLKQRNVPCLTLSGKIPVPARPDIIARFNDAKSSIKVLLLSLCAGGVGLNLVGGNHLLMLDPHWNPQLEEQAQDRIYRMGQKKPVHIYKFMCLDTIEQNIKKLQEHKLAIADSVLTGAKYTKSSKLSIEDLKMLFNMGNVENNT